jgi:hypothetical protein
MYKFRYCFATILCLFFFSNISFSDQNVQSIGKGKYLEISNLPKCRYFEPLDKIEIESSKNGTLEIIDGVNDPYLSKKINGKTSCLIGGAIGTQQILLKNRRGKILDRVSFKVDCQTEINDESGTYRKLLDILYNTMVSQWDREANVVRYNGKYYHYFVSWLRDHVHTLKGMKYFYPELKSGIDLYADSQREDGMIWDNYKHPYDPEVGSYWVQRFRYGDFVKVSEEDKRLFTRIPVENDVEYLFIEGIYYTWKATGDDDWMMGLLDKALKAVEYSTTDPYRWSEEYGLLKRGYTIDTWDFQNAVDADISTGEDNPPDPMVVKLGNTRFGIMYGDNTGFAASCQYLSEMLEYAGRSEEADKIKQLGEDIQKRIDELAWNGNFYRHHVPINENIERDLGVDESKQVSLSNAYSLNRDIGHEKATEIIKTYQRIREEMPVSSPGEFYTIYPPFNKGYGGHNSKWTYMNGGVTSIVAGELAHGAFEHGFEGYGADILERLVDLAEKTDHYLECSYRGKVPDVPEREFITLDMREIVNADFHGKTQEGVIGWTNEGINDLHEFPVDKKQFENVPFDIIDPAENGRRACLGISSADGYKLEEKLAVDNKAESIYFLHTANSNYYAGRITLEYEDGTKYHDEIGRGKILNWWYPKAPSYEKTMPKLKVAWRGKNALSDKVGVCIYGLNNPNPDKKIKNIYFTGAKNGTKWMILGVTLSDHPVYFKPGMISGGIPDNWGAAAVVYALVEGLAGVKDLGTAYDHAQIAPRWESADVSQASATIKYDASQAYISYEYTANDNEIELLFTGSSRQNSLKFLLPENTDIKQVYLDEKPVDFNIETIEKSRYVKLQNTGKGVRKVKVVLK